MKNIPFLSVILSTYNRKYCIARMIDSVLKQNFTDFELIIVDDGSSDNTAEMIEEKYNDCRIKLIKKENGGVSSARNAGISVAVGEWITFVDSDDYLLDGFFEDIYQTLQQVNCEVLVYRGYAIENKILNEIPLFFADKSLGCQNVMVKSGREFVEDFCLLSGNSWGCAKVFKNTLIQKHSLCFDENIHYGEDMLFNLQAYLVSAYVATNPRGFYVCDTESVSLSRGMLGSKQKLENLILGYKALEKYADYQHYFALNFIRHSHRWMIFGYWKLDRESKNEIKLIYSQIALKDCTLFEKIEVRLARKNIFLALFFLTSVFALRFVYSRLSFLHPLTSPLVKVIRKWIYKRG